MKKYVMLLVLMVVFSTSAQELTGEELLNKAIEYHDSSENWSTFQGNFNVTMETPKSPSRVTAIAIDLPSEKFYSKAIRDTISIEYSVHKDNCEITFCGRSEFTSEEKEKHRLTCERAKMYKDYYTYLYGLPMKLKDPGTRISEKVEKRTFKGKEYVVLQVQYDEAVGEDIWYFYFDPLTYAMEVYQFFHEEEKNDGEYILLSEEEIIHGIKMPKIRKWYYNKDDKYLGTDILDQ